MVWWDKKCINKVIFRNSVTSSGFTIRLKII